MNVKLKYAINMKIKTNFVFILPVEIYIHIYSVAHLEENLLYNMNPN